MIVYGCSWKLNWSNPLRLLLNILDFNEQLKVKPLRLLFQSFIFSKFWLIKSNILKSSHLSQFLIFSFLFIDQLPSPLNHVFLYHFFCSSHCPLFFDIYQLGSIKQILMQTKVGSNLLMLSSEQFLRRKKELFSFFGETMPKQKAGI